MNVIGFTCILYMHALHKYQHLTVVVDTKYLPSKLNTDRCYGYHFMLRLNTIIYFLCKCCMNLDNTHGLLKHCSGSYSLSVFIYFRTKLLFNWIHKNEITFQCSKFNVKMILYNSVYFWMMLVGFLFYSSKIIEKQQKSR